MPEKEDKRKKKLTLLQGGKRLAVSESEAADIMGLKDASTFYKKYVEGGFIIPSIRPGSDTRIYNELEVMAIFDKTKMKKAEHNEPISDMQQYALKILNKASNVRRLKTISSKIGA